MKKSKITVLSHMKTGENQSGEELFEWVESGFITGFITPGTSSESWTPSRQNVVNVVTIFCEKALKHLTSDDKLMIENEEWLIDGSPAVWENSRGYRSTTTIIATMVKG